MGHWSQNRRRGGTGHSGVLAAPQSGDWSVGTIAATTVEVLRAVPIPLPATLLSARVLLASTHAFVTGTGSSASSFNVTGLTTGTSYLLQVSWSKSTGTISDWSAEVPFTTP
jgi:hypothetical protein